MISRSQKNYGRVPSIVNPNKSLTHYSAPDSSGPKKSSTILIRTSTNKCRRDYAGRLVLKPGATVSVTRRLISSSFLNTQKRCLTTASKMFPSQPNSSITYKIKTFLSPLTNWNTHWLTALKDKLDLAFHLILINVLISYYTKSQSINKKEKCVHDK